MTQPLESPWKRQRRVVVGLRKKGELDEEIRERRQRERERERERESDKEDEGRREKRGDKLRKCVIE